MNNYNFHGAIAPGDQKLAEKGGRFYLYDYSGHSPDHTDDEPLHIDFTKSIKIDKNYCIVPVLNELKKSYRVGITHKGLLNLKKMLPFIKTEINEDCADLAKLIKEVL